MAGAGLYGKFESHLLSEHHLRYFNYPRAVTEGNPCTIKLYGEQFGFKKDHCKRCVKFFDITFKTRESCDFHTENSRKYRGNQQPHGCCGEEFGSKGCRSAPSHVHKENWHLDFGDFKRTSQAVDNYEIYAMDTESLHTVKGLEMASVTVLDTNCEVIYKEKCLPTTELIDYNTIWSGLIASDFVGVTKTFPELQADLLGLISAKTILVGHGLGTDLMALKIVHDKVVDTLELYPHPRGLPFRKSLKDLAWEQLDRSIQVGELYAQLTHPGLEDIEGWGDVDLFRKAVPKADTRWEEGKPMDTTVMWMLKSP